MATLTVRNLDADVKRRLRVRAARNGRSMEEEVRQILAASVEPRVAEPSGAELYRAVRAIVEPLGGVELDLPPREIGREPPDFSAPEFGSPEDGA